MSTTSIVKNVIVKCQQYHCQMAQKLYFKRVTLGNWSHETACRAVKWAHIRNSNVPRVTSGCVEDIIPLSQVSLSPKNRGYMGVVYKKQIFPNLVKFGHFYGSITIKICISAKKRITYICTYMYLCPNLLENLKLMLLPCLLDYSC